MYILFVSVCSQRGHSGAKVVSMTPGMYPAGTPFLHWFEPYTVSHRSYIDMSFQCLRHLKLSSFPTDRPYAGAHSFSIGAAGVGGSTCGSNT